MDEKTELEKLKADYGALAATVEKMHDQMARRGWFVEDSPPPEAEPAPAEAPSA